MSKVVTQRKVSCWPQVGPPIHPILAPSVLSADFSRLGSELRSIERAGSRWVHLDIMDNHFVPNLTFGPPVVKCLRKVSKRLFFDAHLMTENPAGLVEAFAAAGAQNLTFHVEASGDSTAELIELIHKHGLRAGISLKPKTPVAAIEPYLRQVDLVLVMTVEPGFGGQSIIPSCLNKVRTLRRYRETKRLKYLIEVDGGINLETIELAVTAGAEVLVAGSAVFGDRRVAENVAALTEKMRIASGIPSL